MSSIRFVVLCLFRHEGRILVGEGYDGVKQEAFLRPIGGSVEFGETAEDALRREIREELQAEVTGLVRLGVLENIFTWEGTPGHEVVAVYDAHFVDPTFYEMDRLPLHEDVWGSEARWISLADRPPIPLYPDGLLDLLEAAV